MRRLICPAMQPQLNVVSHYGASYARPCFLLGAYDGRMNAAGGYGIRLAQFASDDDIDFIFCDCGVIDFSINPEDLRAGRWGRAWAATAAG